MTVQGKFIVMTAVNTLLCADFAYVLRICSTNFSFIANTSLFEGNILRLKSLAAEYLYKQRKEVHYGQEEDPEF